jgi:hypothetical protein
MSNQYICEICGKELTGSEAYEYRGMISCVDCHEEAIKKRDYQRQEIIEENKHKTDRFKGLELGNSLLGKINKEILKSDIEIAGKESSRIKEYEDTQKW